jgi:hypothetical protein
MNPGVIATHKTKTVLRASSLVPGSKVKDLSSKLESDSSLR